MGDDIDREDERRKMIALHAAMGVSGQLRQMMADDEPAPEPPKSTGRSRMADIVALRAANWTKDRSNG